MTTATFYKKRNGDLKGFRIEGHSGYAESGSDIVCAAISALVMNTVNSIIEFANIEPQCKVDDENAIIECFVDDTADESSQLFMRSLKLGLSNMEADEETGSYIRLITKEV